MFKSKIHPSRQHVSFYRHTRGINYPVLSTKFKDNKLNYTECPEFIHFVQNSQSCLKSKLHTPPSERVYRATQLSRPVGDSTTFTLRWLKAASCSWYAWNSQRLKQTQAGNKQPGSSSPAPANVFSPVNPFHSDTNRRRELQGLKPAAKNHLVVQAALTSDRQHFTFPSSSPRLSAGQDLTADLSHRTAVSSHSFSILSP